MSSCKLVIKDEVNVKFENLSLEWRKRLSNKFKYEIPYARHLPAVKLGRWDGKVSFFGLGGTTYLNLVDQILPILEDGGVYVDMEDHREKHNFEFKAVDKNYLSHITWPKGHPAEGQPIVLRDYQVETINKFIEKFCGSSFIIIGGIISFIPPLAVPRLAQLKKNKVHNNKIEILLPIGNNTITKKQYILIQI